MAVLGYLVDRVLGAITYGDGAGGTGGTVTPWLQTVPHSLGVVPDYVIPILSSVGLQTWAPPPAPGAMRGNASLNTLIIPCATAATYGTFMVDLVAINVWSGAR